MFNNDNGGLFMPVAPAYYNGGGNNNGGGFLGGEGIWAIIILAMLFNGGFGGFGGGMGGYGNMMLGYDFPWLLNGQQGINNNISDGFRDQMLQDSVTSVRDGISNLSTQLCNCCGDMQMALANGFAGVEQGANTRQIANMQQAFAAQTAMSQGFNGVQSQLAQCCCDNQLRTESLRATVLSENCEDRYQAANNTRDIIDSQTRGTQAILDKLCSLELDNYRRENDQLRTQLNMANLAASQTAQTAQIERGQLAATTALVNELRSCPIPSQPVYGSQPIFTCPNNNNGGCGCGCGGNF